MPETTKTCQVKMHDDKPCGRELYDDECCIFHSKREDKDVELFQKKLNEIFKDGSIETYDFTRFIFPEGVTFPKQISRKVSFTHANFEGRAHFQQVRFKSDADFDCTCFKNKVYFGSAVFEKNVSFRNAEFKGAVNFWLTEFKGTSFWSGAVFEDETDFMRALFKGGSVFTGADFRSDINFWDAHFRGSAHFEAVGFKGKVKLEGAVFDRDVNFISANFEDTLFIMAGGRHKRGFKGDVDFSSVRFSKPENIEFQKVDLSNFRFLNTDVRRVHFADVDWYKEKGKGRNRVFDEVEPPTFRNFDYALIAELYRRLRANYEENLRYSEAGDFYIGEMEMTRKAQTSIFKKLPLLFYKAISNYGESYYRPLGWIAVILLIFPLLFMFAGIEPMSPDLNNPTGEVINYRLDLTLIESFLPTAEKIGDYYTSFLYSMSVFSFIRDKKYTTIDNWGHTLFVLESILSPVTLAFFLLALRRRFKR